jgi:hypothetical protein
MLGLLLLRLCRPDASSNTDDPEPEWSGCKLFPGGALVAQILGARGWANCISDFANKGVKSLEVRQGIFGIPAVQHWPELEKVIIGSMLYTRFWPEQFLGCLKLKEVIINNTGPEFVTINTGSFKDCISLETVVALSTHLVAVAENCFYNCTSLKSVDIGPKFASIGAYAFYACSSLTTFTVPAAMTKVAEFTFAQCIGLQNIIFPANLAVIENHAFYGAGFKVVNITCALKRVEYKAFAACPNVEEIILPSCCAVIQKRAFEGSAIRKAVIPSGVAVVEAYAFHACPNLKLVELRPGVTAIESNAFLDCGNLSKVILSETLLRIGELAFANTPLPYLELPDNLDVLANQSLARLSEMTTISIGRQNCSFAEDVFVDCVKLSEVHLRGQGFNPEICKALDYVGFPRKENIQIYIDFEAKDVCGRIPKQKKKKLGGSEIAVIVLSAVIVVLAVVAIILWCRIRKAGNANVPLSGAVLLSKGPPGFTGNW